MKKIILLTAVLVLISFSSNAQNKQYTTVITVSTFQSLNVKTQLSVVNKGTIKEQKSFDYKSTDAEKVLNIAIEISKTIDELSLQGYKIVATRSENLAGSISNIIYLEKDVN
jgi:hypothetical protein